MIDLNEIEAEIQKLEHAETSYAACAKLADLYSVRDHLKPKKIAEYSYGQSEFLQVVGRAPIEAVLPILDEHMEAIQILHPREYSAILKKIRNLSGA